eukprot:531802-Prymnesium_polylepis.1
MRLDGWRIREVARCAAPLSVSFSFTHSYSRIPRTVQRLCIRGGHEVPSKGNGPFGAKHWESLPTP